MDNTGVCLLGTQFVAHRGEAWPVNHIGFLFDGGTLTDGQIAAIVLDPEEHSEVRVHSMREWEAVMSPSNFARLRGIDAARRTATVGYMEV